MMSESQFKDFGQKLLSNEEFNTLLADQVKYLRAYLKENKSKSFNPMLVVITTRDNSSHVDATGDRQTVVNLIANDFNTWNEKSLIMRMMALKHSEVGLKISCVFLMTEAWVREEEQTPESKIKREQMRGKSLAEYDDNLTKECLICIGGTIDQRMNFAQLMLERDKEMVMHPTDHEKIIEYKDKTDFDLGSDLLKVYWQTYVVEQAALAFK